MKITEEAKRAAVVPGVLASIPGFLALAFALAHAAWGWPQLISWAFVAAYLVAQISLFIPFFRSQAK